MRSAGAATRQEPEPPDAAAVIAGLGRVIAGSGEVHGRLRRHERRIASVIARMEACGDADLAALAGELGELLKAVTVELISDAAHCAELREQAEALAPLVAFREMMTATLIAEGRRLEAAERDAAAAESARPVRHRHRKPHLTMVTGAAAAAVVAASAGTVYVAHDSASVHPWAASRPAAARFHAGPADSAVPAPSLSPSAKPSAAVASAHPAPVVTASPPPSSSPPPAPAPVPSWSPPTPPAPPAPDLIVPSVLQLDGNRGTLTLTAGDQAVEWTLDASQGLSVGLKGGVLAAGQSVQVEVDDPTGGQGWLYASFGGTTIPVEVTSSLAPAVALP